MMATIVLETERLILREFEIQDARGFLELNADPDVIRFTGDQPFEDEAEALAFIKNYHPYQRDGYGRWVCILKENNEFIGFCGLRKDDNRQETDIGFRFCRRFWGKGYATESAKACIEFGFSTLNLPCIIGRASMNNKASIRVLEKVEMKYVSEGDCHGELAVIYRITNPNNIR